MWIFLTIFLTTSAREEPTPAFLCMWIELLAAHGIDNFMRAIAQKALNREGFYFTLYIVIDHLEQVTPYTGVDFNTRQLFQCLIK